MGTLIRGRYEQLEVVGSGGQGRVVRALDHLHDRTVALKIRELRDETDRSALLSEAGTLFRLPPSAHLPIVREDFFDGDDYVIVMDWVEGANLARILHTEGRPGLPPTLVLEWLADAAAALTLLHAQDPPVIHGDIKPSNLILTTGGRVSLVDFGASSTFAAPGRLGGTPYYAAPERAARGEASRASDIYSLASTAFALLTGGPPTGERSSWDGIEPDLAAQLEEAIRAGLATDPARRPATPGELVERLRAGWASSLPTGVLTFCLTDIVGSTNLWNDHPVGMSHALVLHDNTIATAVERRAGRLIGAMGEGDSTVSVFGSPIDAVTAAVDLVRDLAAVDWPVGVDIHVRVALHTGEVEFRDGNYFGLTPSVAARLRALAEGDQVLLSEDTAALVRDHLSADVALIDLGPATLRGLTGRMEIFAVGAPGLDAPPPGSECPYPGLLPFGTADADRYFGRQPVVDHLLARLQAHPFMAVIGASGSGKSSLLQAGVGSRWPSGADVVTPGADPTLVADVCHPTDRLLVVDQFEELFTLVDDHNVRDAFVTAVLALQRPVAIGLRADFYGQCASYRELATAMASHQLLLGPMAPSELLDAIEEPARRAGLRLEPGLVDVLVHEVEGEPGSLPLLAHALRATWEARDGRSLTLNAYRATGGVKGAIGATADQVMASFDETDRALAQQVLLRLVEPGDSTDDTRRRADLTELRPAGAAGRAEHVIDALAAARLVHVDAGTVQVAHEALIREWPQLRGWLDDQRVDLRLQRQITSAAEVWATSGREPTELFRGPRLATATDWLDRQPHASELETEFVRESRAEEARVQRARARANRRLRIALVGAVVALTLALAGALVAVGQGRSASDARDQAEVARLAALSRSLVERQTDVGLLLAVEASRRQDSDDTRSTLLTALEAHPLLQGLIHGDDSGFNTAEFSPDGRLVLTATSNGSGILLWDTTTRARLGELRAGNRIVIDADISPDGNLVVAATVEEAPDGLPIAYLEVWDVPTRTLVHEIESPAGLLTSLSFSDDGHSVVTQAGDHFDRPSSLDLVVWDTETWEPDGEPWTLLAEYTDDSVIVVSSDGTTVAFPDGDGVSVFDVARRTRARHITVPDAEVTALALSSDGTMLAIGLDVGTVQGIDLATGDVQFETVTETDQPLVAIEISADTTMLAAGNVVGRTQLVDVATGALLGPPLAASASGMHDVSFSADGTRLVTTGGDRIGAIWRLDGQRSAAQTWADHTEAATQLDVTPDGSLLISGGLDGKLVVRDLRDGGSTSAERAGGVLAVEVDRTGKFVVSGDEAGDVVVASLPSLQRLTSQQFGTKVNDVSVEPTTGIVAVAVAGDPDAIGPDASGFIAMWDPVSGAEIAPRTTRLGGDPFSLAWSGAGGNLVVAYDNNVVRRYRWGDTLQQIGDDMDSGNDNVKAVAVSPDGAMFAVGTSSGIVRRYDLETAEQIGPDMRGHTFEVLGIAFSPGGTMIASTTVGTGATRLWHSATGLAIGGEMVAGRTPFTIRTLPIDHAVPSMPVFHPASNKLFTPSVDGTVMAWDLSPEAWADAACAIVGRDLTQDEWQQYLGDDEYRETCPG
jgi:WD40 repeat protein/class 3 adenylate cyclase